MDKEILDKMPLWFRVIREAVIEDEKKHNGKHRSS